ncbi:unnamed protein product [Camellia sinensis]
MYQRQKLLIVFLNDNQPRTPAASGYRRSYRSRAPFKTQYVRRRYVQNIPRFIKKTKRGVRKLQLYDEQLRDVKFDNKGVARLLNVTAIHEQGLYRQEVTEIAQALGYGFS